jgi:hypothetical protein
MVGGKVYMLAKCTCQCRANAHKEHQQQCSVMIQDAGAAGAAELSGFVHK